MSRIAFLIAETDTAQDGNYLRLGNELTRRGHEVSFCFMESISMANSLVFARGFRPGEPVGVDEPFPALVDISLEDFDVIWVLSLGMRHSFLDKVQLLFTLQDRCRIINSLDAIMHFKSKYFTASHSHVFKHPFTWASTRPDELYEVMRAEGGKWIVKPPALSFGRDVYLLTSDDPNARVILESMCGPEQDRFCLLQRYVDEISNGEKRVILAGGKPVGQYLRIARKDHRTNIQQGATFQCCELTAEEVEYSERIGELLMSHGAEFVGMDLVYPWVIEFNVINPGGLLTVEQVAGVDITAAILDNIIRE